MNYDVIKEREETLKEARKREQNTWTIVIMFITLVYIGISCGAYHSKHPNLSMVDVIVEHFFDAIFWQHDTKELEKL